MDISFLICNHEYLYQEMKKTDYSDAYINRFRTLIRYIIKNNDSEDWHNYDDIYDSFKKTTDSDCVLAQARSIFKGIELFHLSGIIPGTIPRKKPFNRDSYSFLPDDFKEILDRFIEYEENRGHKPDDLRSDICLGVKFFSFMYEKGYEYVKDISEEDVLRQYVSTHQ
ncbi:MAG: hypothetical protein IJI66_12665 [Erysipelotrichaceae bacterium]|nr:hypothetical protein [Erysipelotrichaceae bacterium]